MTDSEKLAKIKEICRECFNPEIDRIEDDNHILWRRSQALANIYGIILYDGANLLPHPEQAEDQITIDDILEDEK